MSDTDDSTTATDSDDGTTATDTDDGTTATDSDGGTTGLDAEDHNQDSTATNIYVRTAATNTHDGTTATDTHDHNGTTGSDTDDHDGATGSDTDDHNQDSIATNTHDGTGTTRTDADESVLETSALPPPDSTTTTVLSDAGRGRTGKKVEDALDKELEEIRQRIAVLKSKYGSSASIKRKVKRSPNKDKDDHGSSTLSSFLKSRITSTTTSTGRAFESSTVGNTTSSVGIPSYHEIARPRRFPYYPYGIIRPECKDIGRKTFVPQLDLTPDQLATLYEGWTHDHIHDSTGGDGGTIAPKSSTPKKGKTKESDATQKTAKSTKNLPSSELESDQEDLEEEDGRRGTGNGSGSDDDEVFINKTTDAHHDSIVNYIQNSLLHNNNKDYCRHWATPPPKDNRSLIGKGKSAGGTSSYKPVNKSALLFYDDNPSSVPEAVSTLLTQDYLKKTQLVYNFSDDRLIEQCLAEVFDKMGDSSIKELIYHIKLQNAYKRRDRISRNHKQTLQSLQAERRLEKVTKELKARFEAQAATSLRRMINKKQSKGIQLADLRSLILEQKRALSKSRSEKNKQARRVYLKTENRMQTLNNVYNGQMASLRRRFRDKVDNNENSQTSSKSMLEKQWRKKSRAKIETEVEKSANHIISSMINYYY